MTKNKDNCTCCTPEWQDCECEGAKAAKKELMAEGFKLAESIWKEAHKKEILDIADMLQQVSEIYISMDGYKTETAPEVYQQRILKEIYDELQQCKKFIIKKYL